MQPTQLMLVRSLFEDAIPLADQDTAISRLKAVLMLDLSVELLLNAVVQDYATGTASNTADGRDDLTWTRLWQRAQESAGKRAPGRGLTELQNLKRLHEIRNLAQHNGSVPAGEELHRYIRPVRRFLTDVFLNLYDLDFEVFTQADLISNASLREWLQDSASALESQIPVMATVGAKLAFERTVHSVVRSAYENPSGRIASRARDALRRLPRDISDVFDEFTETLGKAVAEELEQLRAESILLSVGIRAGEVREFRDQASHIHAVCFADGELQLLHKRTLDNEQVTTIARRTLDFALRVVLRLQETHPSGVATITFKKRLRDVRVWKELKRGVNPPREDERA